MKNKPQLFIAALCLIITSCNFFKTTVDITGEVTSVKNGTISFLNSSKKGFTGPIIEGKFKIKSQKLPESGYYQMIIEENYSPISMERKTGVEVFLDPGNYSITDSKHQYSRYPNIVSTSTIQNSLSKYYPFEDSITQITVAKLKNETKLKHPADPDSGYLQSKQLRIAAANKLATIKTTSIGGYAKQNPEDEVIAHILAKSNYRIAPTIYLTLIRSLNAKALDNEEGKQAVFEINTLSKLASGAQIPEISARSPDGKKLDLNTLKKDLILIDFWSARSTSSRLNHQFLLAKVLPNIDTNKVGIVSISVDEKLGWWLDAIREDKLTWPQINDLQGSDSPNVYNWGVKRIPTYYLITGKGKMICEIIVPAEIKKEIDVYYKFTNNK